MTRCLTRGSPLMPDVGLLGLPYHHFSTRWLTPHHVLTRLASYFHVVWLEPAHHWRNTRAVGARRRELAQLTRTQSPDFDLYLPEAWLPEVYRPAGLRQTLTATRVNRAWKRLERKGCKTRVLHMWHHRFESALDVRDYDASLYHIDDDYSFLPEPGPMDPAERRVIEKVDDVIVISPALMERKSGINPNMHLIPEGVDHQLYSTPVPAPADIASIPHPRIGYTGGLKPQLDWELLRALALRHTNWSFVFVGPNQLSGEQRTITDEMAKLSNVHFLGAKTVWDLAAYPQHFDVCLMPYVITGYTNNIYPLKLHEYLASGQPTVGTPIRSLLDFGHVISLARNLDEWSSAIAAGLQPAASTLDANANRQAIARQYDWSELIYQIARVVCERLGPSFTDRLEKSRADVSFAISQPTSAATR